MSNPIRRFGFSPQLGRRSCRPVSLSGGRAGPGTIVMRAVAAMVLAVLHASAGHAQHPPEHFAQKLKGEWRATGDLWTTITLSRIRDDGTIIGGMAGESRLGSPWRYSFGDYTRARYLDSVLTITLSDGSTYSLRLLNDTTFEGPFECRSPQRCRSQQSITFRKQ
jgi:hypothetical protein